MSRWMKNGYRSKSYYKKLIDEFFEGPFLRELQIPVSEYISTAEWVDQMIREQKKKEKEAREYFKKLQKTNPTKYDKICRMMGWDNTNSYMEAKTKMGSLYGDMVYMDTDSIKMKGE